MLGLFVELLLLGHYEDVLQLVPLVLILSALAIVGWHIVRPAWGSIRALQVVMGFFLAAGAAGIVLHFEGAAAFQREIAPAISWTELVSKALGAQAPPVLAPGVMMQLGLMGLIYAYRHPAVAPTRSEGARW